MNVVTCRTESLSVMANNRAGHMLEKDLPTFYRERIRRNGVSAGISPDSRLAVFLQDEEGGSRDSRLVLHYGRKEPFRSVPISAKTPAELALVIV